MDMPAPPPVAHLHRVFLAILPRIELYGQIAFRCIRCPAHRQDAIQEMQALAWKWFRRLAERGIDATRFPATLARFAAQAVRNGRRVCGQESPNDVLSPSARQRRGFTVEKLPASTARRYDERYGTPLGQRHQDAWEEALADNTRTPPDEQAAFRIDFVAWLRSQSERRRCLIEDLMLGGRTLDVGRKYGLSPARISQLRRELCNDWTRFCSAPEPPLPGRRA
jgi:hypothetical protein